MRFQQPRKETINDLLSMARNAGMSEYDIQQCIKNVHNEYYELIEKQLQHKLTISFGNEISDAANLANYNITLEDFEKSIKAWRNLPVLLKEKLFNKEKQKLMNKIAEYWK